MKILYGVTGCGLGHTMRARALGAHLRTRGHELLFAASGRAVEILRAHDFRVVPIHGMSMTYAGGAMQRATTAFRLLRKGPDALRANASAALREVGAFDPDAIVTDFDTFSLVIGRLLDRPVISVDHQHVVDRFVHPNAVRARVSTYRMGRAVCRAKTPGCTHYVVTSFFFPEIDRAKTTLVGPIVRPEIVRATPHEGEHVLVYQTAAGDPRLLPTLRACDAKFVVYGLDRDEEHGNILLRRFDEARFVDDLASARAVVANGGFTTLSEAIVLGKPVLSIPVRNQPEQEINAAWIEHLGAGKTARRLNSRTLSDFLRARFRRIDDPRIRSGNADAQRALEGALA